jgi:hypothetical protein
MNISLEPSYLQMMQHLLHLFSGLPDECREGAIEISWSLPMNKGPSKSRYFSFAEIGSAVQFAHIVNRKNGQNVYIGPALRKSGLGGRSKDSDVLLTTCQYADLDSAEANENAEKNFQHCPPTAIVITGRIPHVRQQLWWRLEKPQFDIAASIQLNKNLADALGGDPQVTNPSRLMRLGGSIAWPKKDGRVAEPTQFKLLSGE